MEHGYDTVVVLDGIGDRDIPNRAGTGVVKAETLVDVVADELADAIATVVLSKDIKA